MERQCIAMKFDDDHRPYLPSEQSLCRAPDRPNVQSDETPAIGPLQSSSLTPVGPERMPKNSEI